LIRGVAGETDAAVQRKIRGVIFSDLGQASVFMRLDWVQEGLRRSLGFTPYPATLNVRPTGPQDARLWEEIQKDVAGVPLLPVEGSFCSARLYRIHIRPLAGDKTMDGAVLLPAVADYPRDKIEIVAPVRLKEAFGLRDGDCLDLELAVE
jgi:riboflavin kinase, archaea type